MGQSEVMVIAAVVVFGGAFSVAIVAIIAETIRKVAQTRAKEQSRREIAAYVAEGTITPDDGVRLMEADTKWGKNVREMFAGK